ncbi:MAG: formylglycine-generating enzyme family protein [Gemmataceae bacterium]|jgi:formylglycine-generating enzyme required for sulfatase activity
MRTPILLSFFSFVMVVFAQPQKLALEIVDIGKGVSLELLIVPAGKFTMGSPISETGRTSNELEHEVTISKSFFLGKYEVTQAQWEAIMDDNPSSEGGAKLPVTDVSYEDCQKFIKKLNEKTSGGFRLPTEAEWEYACRAGTKTRYAVGERFGKDQANFLDSKIGKPVFVGSYKSNAFGFHDMNGNVDEWCNDWYGPYAKEPILNPKGPPEGKYRVLRGGAFNFDASYQRSAIRNFIRPTDRDHNLGFRIARNN